MTITEAKNIDKIVEIINQQYCPYSRENCETRSNTEKPWVEIMADCKERAEVHLPYPWLCNCARLIVDRTPGIDDITELSYLLGRATGERLKDGRLVL